MYTGPGRAAGHLTAAQIGNTDRVHVSWVAVSRPPSGGYRLTVASANISMTVPTFSQELTLLGPHTIVVQPLDTHYLSPPTSTSVNILCKYSKLSDPYTEKEI